MRPSRLLLALLAGFCLLGLPVAALRLWASPELAQLASYGWYFALATLTLLAAVDALGARKPCVNVERELPGSFAVGVANPVRIFLHNISGRSLRLCVSDHHSAQIRAEGLPANLRLPAGEVAQLQYRAWPERRGQAHFSDVDIRHHSPLACWEFRQRVALPATVRVYPNFTAISRFEQLGHDQQVSQLGLHVRQRRGQGMDFHQLREYRDGDVSRQIDWKASARRRKLISRDYQDERDQEIIFLLDCGRRMRSRESALSHFDHCLNSLLLLSYVALKQGDAVGMLSFGGEQRWLAPVKGKNNINLILNSVYDLHSSTETSDLLEAASELMARHRKRSLVVIMSNLRDEDRDDVIAASRLLASKHLVLIASLRENALEEAITTPVADLESSLVYCESTDILAARQRLLQTLRSQGALVTDSRPQELHIRLVNEYWALKRSGRI